MRPGPTESPAVGCSPGSPPPRPARPSGAGAIARVDVSTDGGANWRPARLHDRPRAATWTRWSLGWRPDTIGATQLLARATDTAGRNQPDVAVPNTQGYLFNGVVRHPVSVV